jgi:RNA polymerase sigma-70 factor (ECF subfamily)
VQSAAREQETDLARRLIGGEPEAFERFVDYFSLRISHYSWMMCGHREDAEEVAQETLLKVFADGSTLREPEKVKSWVFRIARNECLMKRRKSLFAPAREISLDELMPARREQGGEMRIEIADWRALPEEEALRGEMKLLLEKALQEVPENYRSVVLLRDVESLTTEETAQVLDLTNEVVRTRLHRGRLALRQRLDSYLREGVRRHAGS